MVLYGSDAKAGSPELFYRYSNVSRCHDTLFVVDFPGSGLFKTIAGLADSSEYLEWFKRKVLFQDDWYFFEEGLFDYADEKGLWRGFSRRYIAEDELNGKWFEHRHM